jgi:phosphoribosyl 1,2-cyclic phosphate phosphodiesterase
MAHGTAIVLGSGTSTGVPVLGREYPESFLADPKNHRTRPSLLVQGPKGNLLVDCGPDMRTQLLREGISDIEAVLITHTHADHIMGMDDLRAFGLKYRKHIPVYTGDEAREDIKRVFPYMFKEFPPEILVPRVDFRPVEPELDIVGLQVRTAWVMHGPTPVVAIRMNDFAYVTDVKTFSPEAWAMLQGAQTLILDAVRYRPHPNHLCFDEAVEVAQQIGAETTYFTHLADDYDHSVVEPTLPRGIRLAFDGLRIAI